MKPAWSSHTISNTVGLCSTSKNWTDNGEKCAQLKWSLGNKTHLLWGRSHEKLETIYFPLSLFLDNDKMHAGCVHNCVISFPLNLSQISPNCILQTCQKHKVCHSFPWFEVEWTRRGTNKAINVAWVVQLDGTIRFTSTNRHQSFCQLILQKPQALSNPWCHKHMSWVCSIINNDTKESGVWHLRSLPVLTSGSSGYVWSMEKMWEGLSKGECHSNMSRSSLTQK